MIQNLQLDEKEQVERNPNVFRNWQLETNEIVDQCVMTDCRYMKLDKFIKDPKEIAEVERVIRQHYVFLKQLFTQAAAKSTFPTVSQMESGVLFHDAEILTKDFTQGICDTQFIAARVDVDNRGFKIFNQQKLDCNRFEWLECVVRTAINRYKPSDPATALKQLIDALRASHGKVKGAQAFRDEELWTREVNLTLDANLAELRKLYNAYSVKKGKINQDQAIELLSKNTS